MFLFSRLGKRGNGLLNIQKQFNPNFSIYNNRSNKIHTTLKLHNTKSLQERLKILADTDETVLQNVLEKDIHLKEGLECIEHAIFNRENEVERKITPPTPYQLRVYCFTSSVPFVGFGFFDNSIMLLAGDFFDIYLGVAFGISTLAAAAMGNIVSDVCGLWLGGTIEAVSHRLGLPDPRLSLPQMKTNSAQFAKTMGSVIGVVFGCALGMFPLLWPKNLRVWPDREEEMKHKIEHDHEHEYR
eukprot:c7197_g1_i1.p1 GENE.c7197_g1_i1~~c7197_g1_i1.p1  ORF type:complete len:242 (+),score=59.34 c7197_g1_i1:228-953(+)